MCRSPRELQLPLRLNITTLLRESMHLVDVETHDLAFDDVKDDLAGPPRFQKFPDAAPQRLRDEGLRHSARALPKNLREPQPG